jgi:hypothetical protein
MSASDTSTFLSIPPKIVWVLLRATRLAREDIRDNTPFNNKLGDHFVKIMREACKSHLSSYLGEYTAYDRPTED